MSFCSMAKQLFSYFVHPLLAKHIGTLSVYHFIFFFKGVEICIFQILSKGEGHFYLSPTNESGRHRVNVYLSCPLKSGLVWCTVLGKIWLAYGAIRRTRMWKYVLIILGISIADWNVEICIDYSRHFHSRALSPNFSIDFRMFTCV